MIKIQNIYYMLAYAFQALKEKDYKKIETELFDNAADLFAAILAMGISAQIRRGLGREYSSNTEALSSPIGKIDISASIVHQAAFKRQLVCDFDELSENMYMNKILKTTAMLMIRNSDVSTRYKRELKRTMFYFTNVDELDPRRICWSAVKYNRNNTTYEMLLNVCRLIIEGMLITEKDGSLKLAHYVDDQHMYRLYEKFVLGYYRKHYPQLSPSSTLIGWDTDSNDGFLPAMRTDVTLKYNGKTIIIDAKYYAHTMQSGLYNKYTMHSHNMYQIFAYVKNMDAARTGNVSGVLLYAKTDEDITPDNDYIIGGNLISVRTLDLDKDFNDIAKQLDAIAEELVI